MKTKAEEMEILEDAIRRLGPDTYLGPWLQDVLEEVRGLVRSDIFPELCIRDAAQEVRCMLENAGGARRLILEEAHKDGARIREEAAAFVMQAHARAVGVLRDMSGSLQHVARVLQPAGVAP